MKKFMVLYMASGPEFEKMMKNSTPEQQKKGMDAWMKWMNDHKTSIIEGGAPLGKTKRVDLNGASNTKNDIGGYSVVQAESHDAATKIFGKDHPHLRMPGAWIEILEIMPCLECSLHRGNSEASLRSEADVQSVKLTVRFVPEDGH